jgi:hypothetical protein
MMMMMPIHHKLQKCKNLKQFNRFIFYNFRPEFDIQSTTRHALNIKAKHGELYDAIHERNCGVIIFTNRLPIHAIRIDQLDDKRIHVVADNNFQEKVNLMHVEKELAVRFTVKIHCKNIKIIG